MTSQAPAGVINSESTSLQVLPREESCSTHLSKACEGSHILNHCWVLLSQVELLVACKQHNIPVLCVAGAGAKADPTRLRIVDVSESSIDPLARAVRHRWGACVQCLVPVWQNRTAAEQHGSSSLQASLCCRRSLLCSIL